MSDELTALLAFAEKVGGLTERLTQAEARLSALEARPVAAMDTGLPAKIVAVLQQQSRGDAALYRHLESLAREELKLGKSDDAVVELVKQGTPRRLSVADG